MNELSSKKLHSSLLLLSFSIIAYQIALMQILSFVQWYHFAYMVISIALLGFGTAGTILSLFKEKFVRQSDKLIPLLMILSGLSMPFVIFLSQADLIRFDMMLFFTGNTQIMKLFATYILFMIPFLTAALTIGTIFSKYTVSIGKLYFSNLIGSGIGGLAALILAWYFFSSKITIITGVFAAVSGLILISPFDKKFSLLAFLCLLLLFFSFIFFPDLKPSEFKGRSKALLLQDANLIARKTSPHGIVEIISSPMIRNAEGLSLKFRGEIESGYSVFSNGDAAGNLIAMKKSDSLSFLDFTTAQLPFVMRKRNKSLVLNSGSGVEILRCLNAGAANIIAVEPNDALVDILSSGHPELNDAVYLNNKILVYKITARNFLLSNNEKFDLIILPAIDAFGGTSGLYSLREQFHLTIEAFADMLSKLNPNGVLIVSVWLDYPARNSLKILATIADAMENKEFRNKKEHLIAIKNWNYLTIAVKQTPISEEEEFRVKDFCDEMFFDIVLSPSLNFEDRDRYNKLYDDQFYQFVDQILSSKIERNNLYENYAFNIAPATDDKPFFSQFLRWKNFGLLKENLRMQSIPFLELGYVILYVTLFQIIIAAMVLIILPLFKLGFCGKHKIGVLVYFSGIGLAYMFIEIIYIQMFSLYFGNPIYSASIMICFMLVCSGIGSYMTYKYQTLNNKSKFILIVIIVLLLLQLFFLKEILFSTAYFGFAAKLLIAFLLIAPCSFLMGMPFPFALKKISESIPSLVPWAWGINGFASVVAAVLATVVSIELGFKIVFLSAAVFYSIVLLPTKSFKPN